MQIAELGAFALVEHDAARGLAVLERREQLLEPVTARDRGFLVRLRGAFGALEHLLHGVEVRQHQLRVDDLDVVQRVHLARHVRDVVVFEATHEMRDCVRLADVREELVAEALALRRALDEARDVDELHDGGHHFFRLHDRGDRIELRVGHRDDADVRIDRAERIVLGRNLRRGERVEERRLTDVRQSYDAALDTHG